MPPDHQDSNFRMARQALLDHVPIPPAQVYRMRGEVAPEEAAKEYETAVLNVFQTPVPSFDLILLGMGDDGHTASLFPGSEALQEKQRLMVANWEPSLQAHRITFTLPLINAAKVVAFLDTGEPRRRCCEGCWSPPRKRISCRRPWSAPRRAPSTGSSPRKLPAC